MTGWLANDEPDNFTIDTQAELRAVGEGAGAVQYKNRPLEPDELRHHIQNGMQCTQLALTWQDASLSSWPTTWSSSAWFPAK